MANDPVSAVREVYDRARAAPWERLAASDPLWDERWAYKGLFRDWKLEPTRFVEVDERVVVFLKSSKRKESTVSEKSRPAAHLWSPRWVKAGWFDPGSVAVYKSADRALEAATRSPRRSLKNRRHARGR